jgi:hypothetical protein
MGDAPVLSYQLSAVSYQLFSRRFFWLLAES